MKCPSYRLRPAEPSDFALCKRLYMETMQPLLSALGAWDEEASSDAFCGYYKADEISMVEVDGKTVGWLQVSQTNEELHLDQIHLDPAMRGQGIGTSLVQMVIAAAASVGKPVLLSLVKGNRAAQLYERLGFTCCGEDETKFHMRWPQRRTLILK